MRTSGLLGTSFLLVCSFIPSLLATPKPLLPPIDLDFIIAGLAHTETQLKLEQDISDIAADNFDEQNSMK